MDSRIVHTLPRRILLVHSRSSFNLQELLSRVTKEFPDTPFDQLIGTPVSDSPLELWFHEDKPEQKENTNKEP